MGQEQIEGGAEEQIEGGAKEQIEGGAENPHRVRLKKKGK